MFQLGMIRFAMNFVFGLLSNLRTVIWLAVMITVIGYGYLVFQNDLNFFAAFSAIMVHIEYIWSMVRATYLELKEGLAVYR